MSSPTVLLNNLVQEDTTNIDQMSKLYLLGELVFGINKINLCFKKKPIFVFLASVYSLFLSSIAFYTAFFVDMKSVYNVVIWVDTVHYILCILVNAFIWKRLLQYYQKLLEFDSAVGCKPKMLSSSVKNFIQMSIEILVILLSLPYDWFMYNGANIIINTIYLPARIVNIIGIHFYGHLLSMLVPRLRLINYYMKMSLNDNKQVAAPKFYELAIKSANLESQNYQMKKLMDLYSLIINAYDALIHAIKWQFVMALASTFISLLAFSYLGSLMVIRGISPFTNVACESMFTIARFLPLFSTCLFSDQIQEEVCRLREHVASRLYEDKLNKPGRSVARALLALTEARGLSFSLLQVFDIDISLPFKFVGLLLTYLIILLQFEKVINP